MPLGKAIKIPFPTSSFPGGSPQESAGRLINVFAEPLGDTGPERVVYRRSSGLTLFTPTAQTGYRGGSLVATKAYEVFGGAGANVITVDSTGAITTLTGNLPGTKGVQIARNNAASPNVIAVDLDNGAYQLDTGTVTAYNGSGVLPQPKAVCFQDGYLFFGIADRRVFATGLNALTMNALTFTSVQAKSSDILMRVIPFGGLLFVFCSSCTEIWQDTAQPAPGFPYSRMVVIEYGLAQENAIAGFEDGFSILTWVAQDYGVWQLQPGQFQPTKISPPDLDRLLSLAIQAGTLLDARCYIVDGHKFWCISSPTWTWEFNCDTQKWSERMSLVQDRVPSRWRSLYGHPAFGKWICGDTQTGSLLFMDEHNFTENGSPLLSRMESGPVVDFPNRLRIARADFHFVTGVGQASNMLAVNVTGAAAGTNGVVRLTVNTLVGTTFSIVEGDQVIVANVGGTTEANGAWNVHVVDSTHIELLGSVFANAWTSGGTVTDTKSVPNVVNPTVAISLSRDDGLTFGNPWYRSLGQQAKSKTRISVKNAGLSGAAGDRWRWDISDPVYCAFIDATQSSELREY